MKPTVWKKYKSNSDDEFFPKNIEIELLCDDSGKEIVFDKNYCKCYFLGEEFGDLTFRNGLKQSLKWVEDMLYEVWSRDTLTPNEILRILAWKMGKIDYQKCKLEDKSINYYANWCEGKNDDNIVSLQIPYQEIVYGKDFKPIAEEINRIRSEYRQSKNKSANVAWEALLKLANNNKSTLRGLGTVYLVTLLHFITDGDYPIYDRFAMASLAVWKLKEIEEDVIINPETVITGCSLPPKQSNEAVNLLNNGIYVDYIKMLRDFCQKVYGNSDEWKKKQRG